ncbi:hypothetical protein [Dactylosporangium sp. CA-092794]|uniref:hypothetical protein n=1 Tax=Dactylosporangium sp. CA-092794 TaxID=3239929 RepID=UPI003D9005C4
MRWSVMVRPNAAAEEIERLMDSDPAAPDDFGVRYANVHLTEDGYLFVLVDADSPNALRASLRSKGIRSTEGLHSIWHGSLATR